MPEVDVSYGEPRDRLGRLANDLLEHFRAMPDADGVQVIVMLCEGEHRQTALDGFEESSEALVELLVHLRAIFAANGTEMALAAVPRTDPRAN